MAGLSWPEAFLIGAVLSPTDPVFAAAIVGRKEKLAALLVFGAVISPQFLREIPWSGYIFALLALLLVRPIALSLALMGSTLDWRERVTAAWFGPKGFASVVYGMLILEAGILSADMLFHIVAIVIAASIIAHSSTDVAIDRWFEQAEPGPAAPSAPEP